MESRHDGIIIVSPLPLPLVVGIRRDFPRVPGVRGQRRQSERGGGGVPNVVVVVIIVAVVFVVIIAVAAVVFVAVALARFPSLSPNEVSAPRVFRRRGVLELARYSASIYPRRFRLPLDERDVKQRLQFVSWSQYLGYER